MKPQPSGADQSIEDQHDKRGHDRPANDDSCLDAPLVGVHLPYFSSHGGLAVLNHPAQILG
jgi:hypothetical protein